ncbi:YraN family protein [Actibacterium ureilyticum]|uniref:YraN family protein n=1 Tax=Actibacterium ureilyticum TaxID=1590614 RepID=UPI000BAAFEB8|nr:YraN family protein [Actibacterium ureilyticum]
MSGARSYHAGLAAEDAVARLYETNGAQVLERRWRGTAGEVDLILEQGGTVVFVEVKQSRDTGTAALHLTDRQAARIYAAAEEFLATRPGGLLTETRIDVALVDGQGNITIIENAIAG